MGPSHRIPATIVTGFLGSGKTTLLGKLLRQPEFRRAAVIVNEAGPVGIDQWLLNDAEQPVTELVNGCFCCVSRSSFVETFRKLLLDRAAGRVPYFERVVVETSGLVDPSFLLRDLVSDAVISARFSVDRIVTVVDALNGLEIFLERSEAIIQAAVADHIILTKTDLAGQNLAKLLELLSELAPDVPLSHALFGEIDARRLLQDRKQSVSENSDGRIERAQKRVADTVSHRDQDVDTYCIRLQRPIGSAGIATFFNRIAAFGTRLLRVKGMLNVQERPGLVGVVQGVHGFYHPVQWREYWPDDDRETRIVFITRGVPQETIESTLRESAIQIGKQSCGMPTSSYATATF